MKTFKFLTDTALIIVSIAAIVFAAIALLATVIFLSVLLGSLTLLVHALSDKNTPEIATNGNHVDPITEIASLGKFSGILLRVFVLIFKENISRLKSFISDWVEGGARLLAQCFEFTEMCKKTISAAIVHSWEG